LALLAGCGGSDKNQIGAGDYTVNVQPGFARVVSDTTYDGSSDDLLTAGLGKTGLGSAAAPTLSAPPTAAELRKLAIHTNYRAIVDPSPNGGYGTLYGPNVSCRRRGRHG
jgi:hydroxybutyrate-dimer hydrolase